jgi:oligopeptide transport system ATP-binding protein
VTDEAELETVAPEGPDASDRGPLLQVEGLKTQFAVEGGTVKAVDGVSFSVDPGEVFSVVGESGSGKSVTALSILGLIQPPAGRIVEGRIVYRGDDLVTMDRERRRQIRGDRIAMIFQDALAALNPVQRVGNQIAEVIRSHRKVARAEAQERAVELLDTVGIPNPGLRARDYPHQFSGGMRQRAMIAMAIALDPDLLIADEPTTALDVTVQAQILEVLLGVRERFGTTIILITHDLGVVAEVADRVMVMYAGRKLEEADVETIFTSPKHPYTWGLLRSTTRTDRPRDERLYQIPGAPPSMINPPPACRFEPRCPYAQEVCRAEYPDNRPVGPGHIAACHFAQEPHWGPDMAEARA